MEVSNKVVDYSIYNRTSGTAKKVGNSTDVTLPSIERLTDTIKGAGIGGEIDLPTFGQLGSMELETTLRVSDSQFADLLVATSLEIRWVTDGLDSSNGKVKTVANKAFATVINKKGEEGKLEPGSSQDSSLTYEVIAYKRICDGKEIINIDKMNGIFKVNGVDQYNNISKYL